MLLNIVLSMEFKTGWLVPTYNAHPSIHLFWNRSVRMLLLRIHDFHVAGDETLESIMFTLAHETHTIELFLRAHSLLFSFFQRFYVTRRMGSPLLVVLAFYEWKFSVLGHFTYMFDVRLYLFIAFTCWTRILDLMNDERTGKQFI